MVRSGAMAAGSTAKGNFLNSKQSMLTDSAKRQLEEQGYLILPGFLSPEQVAQFNARIEEIFAEEGDRAGTEFRPEPGTRRLANAVDKGELFEKIIETPFILECMEAVLGADFK